MNNIELTKAFMLGKIAGLNEARISVWGIGFDNDETASYIKKYVWERMEQLQNIIDIENSANELEKFAKRITQQNNSTKASK